MPKRKPAKKSFIKNIKIFYFSIFKHENFSTIDYVNDIGLIILSDEIKLNNFTQIACLPSKSTTYPPVNSSSYAAGWGTTTFLSSATPNTLRNVKLTIYDSSACKGVAFEDITDWSGLVCAGELAGGKDTCQGDSGTPLFVGDTINGKFKYVVAGITSYGIGCGFVDEPG